VWNSGYLGDGWLEINDRDLFVGVKELAGEVLFVKR